MSAVMLKKFAISGDNVFAFKQTEGSVVDVIPAGLYSIENHPFAGYYLKKKSDHIELPAAIYGSTLDRAARCFSTFDRTAEPLTIGLFGSKGAGKTLLANVMAQEAIDRGMPVIDVSDSFTIDRDYLAFIESLGSIVVLFDEFLKRLGSLDLPISDDERKYNAKSARADAAQDNMLTFLQGTGNSKRLTILIDNKSDNLSDYIKDRPGRMRYRYDYESIEPEVVQAVGKDAGLTEAQIESLVIYTQTTHATFDVLRVIVQEWTFFPTATLSDITKVLNVPSVNSYESILYSVKLLDVPKGSEYSKSSDNEGVGEGRNIRIKLNKVNTKMHDELLGKEAYYDSDDNLDDVYNNYEDYRRNHKTPVIERDIYLTQRHLIGYSGTKRKYLVEGITIEVEQKGSRVNRSPIGYNDF